MIALSRILHKLERENIEYQYFFDQDISINSFSPLDNIERNSITWARYYQDVNCKDFTKNKDTVLFLEYDADLKIDAPVVYVHDVHTVFFDIINWFFSNSNGIDIEPKIEETAIVKTSCIGENAYIGHNTYIDSSVKIGNNCTIMHGVVLQGKVTIGDNVFIDSNASVGVIGFGFYKNSKGVNTRIPHVAGVSIGNDVEIGSGTRIERGVLSDTVIGDRVKIDVSCEIAHNMHIGSDNSFAAGVMCGGSTTIGASNWFGLGTIIGDQLTIGRGCLFGAGALVLSDFDDNNVIVGSPARVIRKNDSVVKIKRRKR